MAGSWNEGQKLRLLLSVVALLCALSLLYCRALSRQIDRLEAASARGAEMNREISARIDQTQQALVRIEKALSKAGYKDALSRIEAPEPRAEQGQIKPGLYILEEELRLRSVPDGREFTHKYTIYNIKSRLSGSPEGRTINLGIAIGGVNALPLFYLDTDLDNRVDVDVMRDIVDALPMSRALSRTIDESNAQATYNAFLRRYTEAGFTSLDDIKNSGYSIATGAFDFLNEQSERLLRSMEANGDKADENNDAARSGSDGR